jgi:hypothetical protein
MFQPFLGMGRRFLEIPAPTLFPPFIVLSGCPPVSCQLYDAGGASFSTQVEL